MSVFFRKLRINSETGSATIICSDKVLEDRESAIAGVSVKARVSQNVTFGVLSLIDPETNKVMGANHPSIKALQKKLNVGDEIPGFRMSDSAVVDINTGEPTTLKWIEPMPA